MQNQKKVKSRFLGITKHRTLESLETESHRTFFTIYFDSTFCLNLFCFLVSELILFVLLTAFFSCFRFVFVSVSKPSLRRVTAFELGKYFHPEAITPHFLPITLTTLTPSLIFPTNYVLFVFCLRSFVRV